jgi:hypothetical protein
MSTRDQRARIEVRGANGNGLERFERIIGSWSTSCNAVDIIVGPTPGGKIQLHGPMLPREGRIGGKTSAGPSIKLRAKAGMPSRAGHHQGLRRFQMSDLQELVALHAPSGDFLPAPPLRQRIPDGC